ncbi:MAG: hypothetical protein R2714_03140 [Microthrixaceae bacterium]|nr:hypothetical protein [Microthrixaceae bacterium]MCB1011834.1 hypothetical protein [Microthrixaceae bacterium]MCO5322581.1 hypothetical protein [Microthrixaceae bacterium]
MSRNGNETELVAEAERMLAELADVVDRNVLAAGVFSLAELLLAQTAGAFVGGVASDLAGGGGGDGALAAAVGSRIAVEAAAEAKGVSVRLVVAVTTSAVHVLNSERSDLPSEVARFDRASTEVTVRKMGLSRIVELLDPATGAKVSLHGSVSPISAQSKPDKLVLNLLC